jgi:hypothetical protein
VAAARWPASSQISLSSSSERASRVDSGSKGEREVVEHMFDKSTPGSGRKSGWPRGGRCLRQFPLHAAPRNTTPAAKPGKESAAPASSCAQRCLPPGARVNQYGGPHEQASCVRARGQRYTRPW